MCSTIQHAELAQCEENHVDRDRDLKHTKHAEYLG
jgi:hypothetical protein